MKRVSILVVAMILSLVWTTFGPIPKASAAETVIKLKIQSAYGKTHYSRQFVEYLLPLLEKRSNGRLKFTYYPGEAVMTRTEAFDGVREGVLDLSITAAAYVIDRMGIVGATQWIPANWDYEIWQKHSRDQGSYYDWADPYFTKVGLKLLSTISSEKNLFFSRLPTSKIEDLRGQRWRSVGTLDKWYEYLGIRAMPIKLTEFYEGVQRGVIDGGTQSLSGYVSEKWYEVAPNFIFAKIGWCSNMHLVINLKVYNDLPADLREMFDKAVLETEDYLYQVINKKSGEADWAKLKAYPRLKIWEPTNAENARLLEMSQPFFNGLAKEYPADWSAYLKMKKHLE